VTENSPIAAHDHAADLYAPPTDTGPSADASGHDPYAIPQVTFMAARWRRFVARMIDTVVVAIPTLNMVHFLCAFGVGIFFPISDLARVLMFDSSMKFRFLINALAVFPVPWIYAWMLVSRGYTPGKWLLGLRVMTVMGCRISWSQALKREFPFVILSTFPIGGRLSMALDGVLILRDNRRCLHDEIANTEVVSLRP
jgi:uncharacterized RDD family membrane protein YckC